MQNPLTREVLGVEYSDDGGATVKTIKAKHGVIMCVGGFENSKIKQAWYNHAGIFQQCWGTPYNTGDGIDICSAAGAAMWHLEGCEWSACAYRLPSEEVGCAVSMPEKGYDPYTTTYFWVNKYGSRFMNEQTTMNHNIGKTPLTDWTHNKGKYPNADEYPNLPFWMVFDQNMYDKVQLYQGTGYWGLLDTYCAVQGLQPTEGWNDYALDKGWIVKADTIEELAELIGKDPENLRGEVDHFNEMVEAGVDADFGRDITTMAKIETPPFYAIEEFPAMPACSGGARRNIKGEVLNWDDEPIENLYSAGELGSLVSNLYQNGTYLHEAICSARAAIDTILGGHADLHPTEGAGVSEPWAEAADGEYPVEVVGLHDPYTVIFTIKDKQLVSIALGDGKENMFMTEDQFNELADEIVSQQTMGVDTIAGATVDSQAIIGGLMTAFGKKTS